LFYRRGLGRRDNDVGTARRSQAHLTVTFLDHERDVPAGTELVFGRGADLDIDRNLMLHRSVGRFVFRNDVWWLENLGNRIELTVTGDGTRWSAVLPPGTQTALATPRSTVRFSAGPARYELGVECDAPAAPTPALLAELDITMDPGAVELGPEHRALLAMLASRRLLGIDSARDLPTNQEVADQLGWTLKKVNRKIDWICAQFTAHGVAGLKDPGMRSNERRRHLVDHVLDSGQITSADLRLAGFTTPPRARSRS
jgi:hypothetical protein